MKRVTFCTALALSLLAAPFAFSAERPVANDEKSRVTIDTSSVQPAGRYVQASFWAYTGKERIPVVALVAGCDKGAGEITYKVDPEDPGALEKIDLWKADGGQLTDKMAAAACRHAGRG